LKDDLELSERMTGLKHRYYETRPGLDTLRFLASYGFLTLLARRAAGRPHRLFTEITSGIDRHILSEGVFEKGVIDLLTDVIQKTGQRGLMIDIGANIGNHTVALAHLFDQVESVEPHPVLYRILTANVIRNGLSQVTCHNFGLADEDTTGTLTEPDDNHGIARVKERSQLPPETFGLSSEAFGNEYAIELKSAHDFVAAFAGQLDNAFIKIDVEGMEQEIVTAIGPLLETHKPLVGFEWFTKAQPELTGIVSSLPGYELWGIRMHDVGRSHALRAMKILFTGRSMTLERIDPGKLDAVYPLALLVPAGRLG
jgi:FkbM family methyltransferase